MKRLISACIAIALCFGTISAKTFLVDSHLSVVSNETLATHNQDGGTYALYKGKFYRIGVTGFLSLKEFASNAASCGATAGDTLYVAPGKYTEDATIKVAGLTILGHNANKDWTSTRDALESELQASLRIEASNITVNGFKVTGNGRILSNSGTNSAPFSGIKVLYNYFCNSTIVRNFNYPLVEIGDRYTNADAPSNTSQLRYLNCEVAHNYFYLPEGTTTTHPCGVAVCGAGGTTRVHDNYFYETGTSVLIENAQGNIHINHNVFKDVGVNTIRTATGSGDNDKKGDFSIVLYRSAFANSTNVYIQDNEFDNCQGQETLGALIRVWAGNPDKSDFVTPVNFKININRNSFKGKTSIVSSDIMEFNNNSTDQAAENLIVYQDNRDQYDNVIYNLQDNRYDNRLYKFAWIKLNDGSPRREIYANNFTQFILAHDYSTFGNSQWSTGAINSAEIKTDITNVATYFEDDRNTAIRQYPNSVIQSMDIDPITGDIYVLQKLGKTHNEELCSAYGLVAKEEEGLRLTRIPCIQRAVRHTSNPDRRLDQYDIDGSNCQSMQLLRAGHGVKLSIVRDKNGQLWMLTGGKGDNKGEANDISGNAVTKFKFVNGARAMLTEEGHSADLKRSDMSISFINHPLGHINAYGAVDEFSRYFCFSSSKSGVRTYCIYDLDEILEGKTNPKLLKEISIPKYTKPLQSTEFLNGNHPATDSEFNAIDKGFETWPYQSYAISGDYIYFLEGISDSSENDPSLVVKSGEPVIVVSTYNWRTNQYLKRYRVNYARVNRSFGEPEGLTVRPDIYGHSSLYIALADGGSNDRRTSIYRWHVNRYVQHFDESDGYETLTYRISGDDDNPNTLQFDNTQYSGITFTHDAPTEGLAFSASQRAENVEAQSVTITNTGEYRYGAWDGTISGEDAGLFSVEIPKNDQFSTETVTATIKFTPDGKKREYSASLRLFSTLATNNVESNDIVIPLKATYTGEIVRESKPNRPHIETYQVTETTEDDATLYSFNLALNAKLPDEYDNAYLAYTSYDKDLNGITEVIPFRQLIDHYVVEINPEAEVTMSEDQVTHLTIGNDNNAQQKAYISEIGDKKVNNVFVIEPYTEGSITYEASKSTEDVFVDEMTIPNAIQVNLNEASDTRQDETVNYTDFEQVYSKPLIFHNVDPNKSYPFKVFLSGDTKYTDAWQALHMDYYDGTHTDFPYNVAGGYKSSPMVIPGTMYNHLNINVSEVDVPEGMETPFNTDRTLSAMPMGVAKNCTNTLVTDPIHFTKANMVSSVGYFNRLHVTDEVLEHWDVNYNMAVSIADNDDNNYGTYSFSYPISLSGNGESNIKIGEVNDHAYGSAATISYLPIKMGENVVIGQRDALTQSVASYNQPITEKFYSIKPLTNVNYTRSSKNNNSETTTIIGTDNQQEIISAQEAEPVTDIIVGDGINKLTNIQSGDVYLFHKKNKECYRYDAISTVKWDAPDGYPVHGIGYYFDNGYSINPETCANHEYVYNRGGSIFTTKPVLSSGVADNFELLDGYKKLSENTRIYTDVDVFHYEYNDSNNWSQIAAEQRLLPIHINHIYDNHGERITDYSMIPSIKGTITAEYPFLFYKNGASENYSPVIGISHSIGGTENPEYNDFGIKPSIARSEGLNMPTILTLGNASHLEISLIEAIPTGIENINYNNNFNIYPNPATEYVNITNSYNLGLVEIYSIDGQLLISEEVDDTNTSLWVGNLPKGTYIIRTSTFADILLIK